MAIIIFANYNYNDAFQSLLVGLSLLYIDSNSDRDWLGPSKEGTLPPPPVSLPLRPLLQSVKAKERQSF